MEKVENIKKYMAIANVNQRELADTAGIAQTTLSKMLNSKYPISHKYLLKIAKALDVSVRELEEEQTFSPNAVVEGYIEYCGEIKRIRTYRDFEKLAKRIEYETKELPKEVRKIRAENNRNKQIVKKSKANSSYLFNIDDRQKNHRVDNGNKPRTVLLWILEINVVVIRLCFMGNCFIHQNLLICVGSSQTTLKNTSKYRINC